MNRRGGSSPCKDDGTGSEPTETLDETSYFHFHHHDRFKIRIGNSSDRWGWKKENTSTTRHSSGSGWWLTNWSYTSLRNLLLYSSDYKTRVVDLRRRTHWSWWCCESSSYRDDLDQPGIYVLLKNFYDNKIRSFKTLPNNVSLCIDFVSICLFTSSS